MKMLAFLNSVYPHVVITLHAGELTPEMVPSADIRNHIQQTITIANASRIGHGVSIRYEADWKETLANMAASHIRLRSL